MRRTRSIRFRWRSRSTTLSRKRIAVGEPAVELAFGQILQRFDEHRIGRVALFGMSRFRQLGGVVPTFGRGDERLHDRLVTVGEEPVVFGDGAGADRVAGFHALGDIEQLARFADQAQARQPTQQVFEQLAERAGTDDSARLAAFCERHVEQLLRGEPFGEGGPVAE